MREVASTMAQGVRTALGKTATAVRPARRGRSRAILLAAALVFLALPASALPAAPDPGLDAYVAEALAQNPDIQAAAAKLQSSRHRIPQAKSLPDPSVSVGYQNDGLESYTYGNSIFAVWTAGISQSIPYPGKLMAKGEIALKESENLDIQLQITRLKTAAKVKEAYYELFLAYKSLDILERKEGLLGKIEEAALARYGAGVGSTQDVFMAQSEKYALLEKKQTLKQKIVSLEAVLQELLGRRDAPSFPRPAEPSQAPYPTTLSDLLGQAAAAPETKSREKMVEAAQAKVKLAKREFVPDVTVNAGYGSNGVKVMREQLSPVPDGGTVKNLFQTWGNMWSVGISVTIPLYFWTKQMEGLKESRSDLSQAQHELEAARNGVASIIRDNYAQLRSAEKLMAIYKASLGPRSGQDFDLAMARYAAGGGDALTVLSRLKNLFDYEMEYWARVADKGKIVARIEALVGALTPSGLVTARVTKDTPAQ